MNKVILKPLSLMVALVLNLLLVPSSYSEGNQPTKSIAFYYSTVDSIRELLSYDRVVLTPDQISISQISKLQKAGTHVYAYLSVGEANNIETKAKALGENIAWNSTIMDLNDPKWQDYLVKEAARLKNKGFDGLFLDTLDSYQMIYKDPLSEGYLQQKDALIKVVNSIAEQVDEVLLNRGFEILNQLQKLPSAVVSESLKYGYDANNNSYFKRTPADTKWLQNKLSEVQNKKIETIVIDYLPMTQLDESTIEYNESSDGVIKNDLFGQDERLRIAKELVAEKHTPYVSDGLLKEFGVSTDYPIARRILGFYDGLTQLKKQSSCHRFLSTVIEYKGYVPECLDVNKIESLSYDTTRYAGVVYWLSQDNYSSISLQNFLSKTLHDGRTRTLFIGDLPEEKLLINKMGLQPPKTINKFFSGQLNIEGVELKYPLPSSIVEPITRYQLNESSNKNSKYKVLATLSDENKNKGIGIVKTPWGGIVANPLVVHEFMGNRIRWALNPFKHIMPLLDLPKIPVPDVTTESGQRILTAHIDGDGFPSRTWTSDKIFAAESIYREVFKKYQLPHTVSIIEGEIAPHGLYPEDAFELEKIAKKIFKLNHIEAASHTFSHPYFWDDLVEVKEKKYGDSLPIPNYKIDYTREIEGSVNYINKKLLTDGKKVKVFLWSGLADPTPNIIKKTKKLNLYNVNGGNTYVVKGNFSIAQVYPHINWHQGAVQVYAPLMNENLFTELWTENLHGFSHAIESFQLLGEPRRLKAMGIYYHMYSGVYPASINALHDVYGWVLKQKITPLYLSEYAQRASVLYETGIGKTLKDSNWNLVSTGIRSYRIPKNWLITKSDKGIIGVKNDIDGRYLSVLAGRQILNIVEEKNLTNSAIITSDKNEFSGIAYLESANGVITESNWQKNSSSLVIEGYSHVNAKLWFNQARGCEVQSVKGALNKASIIYDKTKRTLHINGNKKGKFSLLLSCKAKSSAKALTYE